MVDYFNETLPGPSVTPRSSGFGGGSGTPRASSNATTPRGGGGYPGGVTPGGSTPRSVRQACLRSSGLFVCIFLISCLIEVFLLGPMAVLLAVVLSKALAAQQGRFQLLQKHVLAS